MPRRRGVVLLEAIVALAITAVMAAALLDIAVNAMTAARRARSHDAEVSAASRLLSTMSLWSPGDLDRRLGQRRQGPWTVDTHRVAPATYTIVVLDSAATSVVLATTVYRPGPVGP